MMLRQLVWIAVAVAAGCTSSTAPRPAEIDGATVYFVFLAIGAPVDYDVCLVGVVIGSVAATIGMIPMGLGTFEAGMIASLTVFGVPVEDALTATLVYRGLSLWLPLIPGFFIIQREMLRIKSANFHKVDSSSP